MKELILIRHGEAEHLLTGVVGGWTDTKLTELGKQQAHCTAVRAALLLQDTTFRLYSSDLSRARQTAQIIGHRLASDPICVEGLRELSNGAAANLSVEEADKIRNPVTDPVTDWVPYPGAESWRMMHDRLSAFMEELNVTEDVVVIVSHSNAIISLIHYWLRFSPDMFNVSFDIQPCSITRLRINKWGERTISKLNDTAHLEVEGLLLPS
ncbi:histidine phosphatase family protein [Paenibacillus mendelii]|uniref:Histidine phosphatase family protein n=1 Tax=Paenibacillus mendelii TaxID=206163 RepID=A0ABV6J696_9BACL|nr:histidine phosphatase family protein [Paenibacillus mendelii]